MLSDDAANAAKSLFSSGAIPIPNLMPDMSGISLPHAINIVRPLDDANLASGFYDRLTEWIHDFDASLDNEYEVGVRLVNFGQAIIFSLRDMSYWNPSLISFIGETDNGDPVELIQHVSQISVLLMKIKRRDLSQPKRPIGFARSDEEADHEATND
jgi:Family of unknown function (DUF6173)